MVKPRGNGGARLAEEGLERGLEQGGAVGVELVLIGVYVCDFGVLSSGSRCGGVGIIMTYVISFLPTVT